MIDLFHTNQCNRTQLLLCYSSTRNFEINFECQKTSIQFCHFCMEFQTVASTSRSWHVDLTVKNELFKVDFWPSTINEHFFCTHFARFHTKYCAMAKISMCTSFLSRFFWLIEQREQHTHTCKITAIAHKIRNMNIKCIVSRVKSIYRTSLINVCYMHTYTLHMHTNCMRRTTDARASPRQLNCTMAKKLKQSHTRHVICYRVQTVAACIIQYNMLVRAAFNSTERQCTQCNTYIYFRYAHHQTFTLFTLVDNSAWILYAWHFASEREREKGRKTEKKQKDHMKF